MILSYATALHELGHRTGAKARLDRDLFGRFGDQSYAAEELIAELTSAFLCAELGIKGELRHTPARRGSQRANLPRCDAYLRD
jgi:antirestriction protein ArdC